MKKFGFTLAEVLITLGIIGVVAAITVPNLITTYKAKRYRTQFLKSYSTLQQIFKQMEANDVAIDGSSYSGGMFRQVIKPYMNNAVSCKGNGSNSKLCLSKDKNLYNNLPNTAKIPWENFDDGQFILADGSQLFIENPTSSNQRVIFFIDLNGYINPPNRAGIDLFAFQMTDNEVVPMGAQKTNYSGNYYCNSKVKGWASGLGCAVEAKNNSDYFKSALKIK